MVQGSEMDILLETLGAGGKGTARCPLLPGQPPGAPT